MRERLIELRERRAHLQQRANLERETLATFISRTDAATNWVQVGRSMIARLGRRPLWIAGAVALLVVLQPRRALKWLASGITLLQLFRRAHFWWLRIAPLLRERTRA